MPLALVLVT